MVWTLEAIEQLTHDWSAGYSITQIGKKLGMTRNAVVGKAHRIGLAKRASPIVRAQAKAAPYNGPRCKWPVGDPRSTDFGFCSAPAAVNRPYCSAHCAMAYSGWAVEEKNVNAA